MTRWGLVVAVCPPSSPRVGLALELFFLCFSLPLSPSAGFGQDDGRHMGRARTCTLAHWLVIASRENFFLSLSLSTPARMRHVVRAVLRRRSGS
ncbi:hypothetical protein BDA96_01G139500 [Sorghum bicolor]|uniref:Secreted protein n=2 Tax=Sorghum bicolor TaxID=4558 RepID=A0A921RZL5_SORBI|nr:hypothetical protein SORBI_3001G134000 [Sorghum bicolor]KAG0548122.1 hypothetical protein BDA96_01G139500 [Sorghum bicolor]